MVLRIITFNTRVGMMSIEKQHQFGFFGMLQFIQIVQNWKNH
jgi:hypothetical protein